MSKYENKKPGAFVSMSWMTSGKDLTKHYVKKNAKQHSHTIYGTRALNAQLPGVLKKSTEDWDVFAPRPRQAAHKLERQIDNYYKADVVDVHPAQHPGTHRVLSNIGEKEVADYSKPDRPINTVTIKGIKYQSLSDIKRDRQKILKDPTSKYRHRKDINVLGRIRDYRMWRK